MTTSRSRRTPSPGTLLREQLKAKGWKQSELAQRCGCSPGVIHRIVTDRSPVSPVMDYKLSLVLGTPGGYWLHANNRWIAALRGWETLPSVNP